MEEGSWQHATADRFIRQFHIVSTVGLVIAFKVRRFHGPELRSGSGLGVRFFLDATHPSGNRVRLIEVPCGYAYYIAGSVPKYATRCG